MAVAKKKSKEPSCPLWLATYGDMVTNMLVFFVLLLSMSEIKKEEKFIEFMQAIREAFGYVGGIQALPLEQTLEVKNVDTAQMLVIPIRPHDLSQSPDPGIRHQHHQVQAIRPAPTFTQGGKIYFDELSATLTPTADANITEYAQQLRGHTTQVEVRGHCSHYPVADSGFADHYALAMARAQAVANALMRHDVSERRIILVSAGVNEPIITEAYTAAQRHENDRVELFEVSRRVEEFETPRITEEPVATTQATEP